jgi:Tol biopolymer transport system component
MADMDDSADAVRALPSESLEVPELASSFLRFVEAESAKSHGAPTARLKSTIYRPLLLLILAVALAGCGSGGAATSTVAQTTESEELPATSSATEVPPGAFSLDLRSGKQTPLASTSVEDVAFDGGYYYVPSPDGSWVYWEAPGTTASVVARIDGSQGQRLDPQGTIDYYAGGWSPDGSAIVYQRRDSSGDDFGNLFVEDVASGRTTRITDLVQRSDDVDGWWYLAPTFSPDGRNVIYQWPRASSRGISWALWSVPVTGGKPRLLVKNAAQATTSDRPTYAFVRPMSDFFNGSSLVVAAPGGFRTIVKAKSGIFEPKMSPDGRRIAYADDGSIYVVNVLTGNSSEVAVGRMASWVDNGTLVVAPDS